MRVDERQAAVLDVLQEGFDVLDRQVDGLPELGGLLFLHSLGQLFDLRERHEGWLLGCLGVLQASTRERCLDELGLQAPIPHRPERDDFLFDRRRTQLPFRPVVLGPTNDESLKLFEGKRPNMERGTKVLLQVIPVDLHAGDRGVFETARGDSLEVCVEELFERPLFGYLNGSGDAAVRQEERHGIGVLGDYESAAFNIPQVVLDPCDEAVRLFLLVGLQGSLEPLLTEAEADEIHPTCVPFVPGHR